METKAWYSFHSIIIHVIYKRLKKNKTPQQCITEISLWLTDKRERTCIFPTLQHLATVGLIFFFSIHHLQSLTFTICQWKGQRREISQFDVKINKDYNINADRVVKWSWHIPLWSLRFTFPQTPGYLQACAFQA